MTNSISGAKLLAFVGSYAEASAPGVYACLFDGETGKLELTDSVSGLQNPTFLDLDERKLKLYALSEITGADGQRIGAANAYEIDAANGRLSLLNSEPTVPAPTCHIALDRTRQCLMTASYHGGMVGLSPVLEDGRVGPVADIHRHEGASVLPVQDRPRAHSVFVDRANRYAVACDLGLDKLIVYKLDVAGRRLIPHGETRVAPGAGPRHLAYHPTLPYAYVINELNATITALAYDEENGALTEIHTVSTLPESYQGDNACADIHLSPDGRFLYGSNRGHDSIAVYAVDAASGKLTLIEHAPAGGKHPRNFALTPDGRFVLVANRDTNNIVTYARDVETGKLQATGAELEVSKPVCIKFLQLA
ncbi:lactonase family protein [Paenibacillus ginsengihumi]|uniref:lactonase family protein n=1 Tax=Paenibacillus ginsengihumi TaxID=431596 RepID=UPI0003618FCF|nr:lactonase family protein [Paenibacillus ginsengihumi]